MLLGRVAPGDGDDRAANLGIPRELQCGLYRAQGDGRSSGDRTVLVRAIDEHDFTWGCGLGVVAPDEEAIDMWVGVEPLAELAGHEIETAGAKLRMIDRGQRVEDGAIERAARLDRDVTRRLFRHLFEDDRGLRFQRRQGAVLEVEDQSRRTESDCDGEHHRPQSSNRGHQGPHTAPGEF